MTRFSITSLSFLIASERYSALPAAAPAVVAITDASARETGVDDGGGN